jgi:hypothetical protein
VLISIVTSLVVRRVVRLREWYLTKYDNNVEALLDWKKWESKESGVFLCKKSSLKTK